MAKAEDHASPRSCHGGRQAGRQDISAPSYFQSANALALGGTVSFKPAHFFVQTRVTLNNGGVLSGFCFFFFATRQTFESHREGQIDRRTEGERDRQTGTVGLALSLTDLMRGTLSRVQHKVGPLCKCSSSSHDWLYNLERQTCMNTCAHAGYSRVAEIRAVRNETGKTQAAPFCAPLGKTRALGGTCQRGRTFSFGSTSPLFLSAVCFSTLDKCVASVARWEFREEKDRPVCL